MIDWCERQRRMGGESTLNLSQRLEAFERAWAGTAVPDVSAFLADAADEDHLGILYELIPIDLEMRWKSKPSGPDETVSEAVFTSIERWKIEDYLQRFPGLGLPANVSVELLQIEFRVRHRWGDRPDIDEYLHRFPGRDAQIEAVLRDVLVQLPAGVPSDEQTIDLTVAEDGKSGQLLRVLHDEELVPAAVLDEIRSRADVVPSNSTQLGRELLERRLLTPWQLQRIAQGQIDKLRLGDYLIVDELGAGGMGVVYKAVHRRMRRVVALKVLPQKAMESPDAVRRFQQEVRVIAQLTHRNVVTAFDAGEDDGVHYLVMEYVDGVDLRVHVKKHGPLPLLEALRCIIHAARGLDYAHQQGIVHRDVKPGNLLLTQTQSVKLLDLGLARMDQSQLDPISGTEHSQITSPGSLMGTAEYMAPEQAHDTRQADARADIYSLGCTLFFLLTGRTPFRGESVMETLLAHHQSPVPSLRDERPDVPIMLDAVFKRMVAKHPQDRPQSMGEVVKLLEAVRAQCLATPPKQARVDLLNHPDLTLDATIESKDSELGAIQGGGILPATLLINPTTPVISHEQQHRSELWKQRDRFRRMLIGLGSIAAVIIVGLFLAWRSFTQTTIAIEWPESERRGGSIEVDGRSKRVPERGPILITGRPGRRQITLTRPGYEDIDESLVLLSGESHRFSTGWLATLETLASSKLTELSASIDDLLQQSGSRISADDSRLRIVRERWLELYRESDDPEIRSRAAHELRRLPSPADALDPQKVSAYERRLLTDRDSKASEHVVAVMGDSRLSHWGPVTDAVFSKSGHLITASSDGTVVEWNVITGEALRSIAAGSRHPCLAIASDGTIAVGTIDNETPVTLYDGQTWERVSRSVQTLGTPARSLSFTPDGRQLMIGYYKNVRAWNLEDGTTKQLPGTGADYLWVSPDGAWLAASKADTDLRIVNLRTEEPGLTISRAGCTSLRFSDNGQKFVAAIDSALSEWDLGTGQERVLFDHSVHTVAFDPRNAGTMAIWFDGPVTVWESAPQRQIAQLLFPSPFPVGQLKYAPDGSLVVAAGHRGEILAWETDKWERVPTLRTIGHLGSVSRVRVTPDGERAVSFGSDGMIRVWDLLSGTQSFSISTGDKGPHSQALQTMAVSHAGDLVAVAGRVSVAVFDLTTNKLHAQLHDVASCTALVFSPDDSELFIGVEDAVTRWRLKSDEVDRQFYRLDGDERLDAAAIALSPDGKTVAAAFGSPGARKVRLWSRKDGMKLRDRDGHGPIAYLSDGRLLYTKSGTVEFISPDTADEFLTGGRITATPVPHDSGRFAPVVSAVAVNPVDGRVATAYSDGIITLWNKDMWRPQTFRVGPHRGKVHDLVFTPDGRHLITANGNGTLYVLRLKAWPPATPQGGTTENR